MSGPPAAPLVINGWTIFAHPLFLDQLEELMAQVTSLKQKDPEGYIQKNATKRLAAITKLALDSIPADPALPVYRQGRALGDEFKHWFCAKFFQQYRLFFRYHAKSKMIVYAWVNDEKTLRAYNCQRRRKNHPCGGAKVYHFGVPGAGDGSGLSALARALPR